jgi:hypothetical protein
VGLISRDPPFYRVCGCLLFLSPYLYHSSRGLLHKTLGRLVSTPHKSSLHLGHRLFHCQQNTPQGPAHRWVVMGSLTTFNFRFHCKGDNLYWNTDPIPLEPIHTCVECSQTGATVACTTHPAHMGSRGFSHATCFILQHQHICTHCQSRHEHQPPSFN